VTAGNLPNAQAERPSRSARARRKTGGGREALRRFATLF